MSILFSAFVMPIAMHSLLGPLVRLFSPVVPRRFAIRSIPSTGSIALRRTASGFPPISLAVKLTQKYRP